MSRVRWVSPVALAGLVAVGCGIFDFPSPSRQTDNSSGGAEAGAGNRSGTAGASGIAGAASGASGMAGSASGGAPSSGGNPSSGGAPSSGGSAASSGATPAGGAAAGGAAAGGAAAGGAAAGGAAAGGAAGGDGGVLDCVGTENTPASGCQPNGHSSPLVPECMQQPITAARPEVIDDFADCNTCLRFAGGRTGFWHGFQAETGREWLIPDIVANPDSAPNLPQNVLHLSGGTIGANFFWGLELWLHASSPCDVLPVDLSAYGGISFWLKSATGAPLLFTVEDASTLAPDGGTRFDETLTYDLGISNGLWAHYSVAWSLLNRRNGPPLAPDPRSISSLTWEARDGSETVELFLGDVELIPPTD